VNHPTEAGRPLVEGWAGRGELLTLHVLAATLAVCAAIPLGRGAVALIAVALAVSQMYSARPVRLSYRVAGAPLALGVAYVAVPYSLGIIAADGDLRHAVSPLAGGLFLLFAARIVLKDFRDRTGDALYGKPTILLRYGKAVTCSVSIVALAAGDLVLAFALAASLLLLVQAFVAAIAWMLWRLWTAADEHAEQVAIGIGARMGNGLLLTLLTWLTVTGTAASTASATIVSAVVAVAFFLSVVPLATRPEQAIVGYKG
jgi:4-hydroxybenzoate polyprenyltransferase